LFLSNPDPYNAYSHALFQFGGLLIAAEFVLIAFLVLHVISAIRVIRSKSKARPEAYKVNARAGAPGRKTLSSTTMIFSGVALLVFIILHLKTYKYGTWYTTTVDGVEMRDLYRLVYLSFQNPAMVVGYVAFMAILGFHLFHGVWSAFQSLGLHGPKFTPFIQTVGFVLAMILAAGFLVMPVWIYINPLGVAL